jgi:hypothetical protein
VATLSTVAAAAPSNMIRGSSTSHEAPNKVVPARTAESECPRVDVIALFWRLRIVLIELEKA